MDLGFPVEQINSHQNLSKRNKNIYLEDPNGMEEESIGSYKNEEKDGHLDLNGIFFDNDE